MNLMLETRDLTFRYPRGTVLHDINIHLEPGRLFALLGANGGGKSTLLRLLAGMIRSDRGRILFANTNIRELSRLEIAKRIGFVPQQWYITFSFAVAEVIAMGRYAWRFGSAYDSHDDHRAIASAMTLVNVEELAKIPFPNLSRGEQQRVLIASALVQNTPVLLLDEATSALDIGQRQRLLEKLKSLAREKNVAILWASHDVNLALAVADKLFCLLPDHTISSCEREDDNLLPTLNRTFSVSGHLYRAGENPGTLFTVSN
jgi:ABC-type cobalamin/Fe3+-siderophores transport system ATPase subunit